MAKTIYDIQSAEWEKTVELHYLLEKGAQSFDRLIDDGYGVYPEILTFMVSLGYFAEIADVLTVAEKYDPHKLCEWMKLYYKDEWKQKVILFELQDIATYCFTPQECADAKFWEALKRKKDQKSKDLLVEEFGIEYLKQVADNLLQQIYNQTASSDDKSRHIDLLHYLYAKGEFSYLYQHHEWIILGKGINGFKYLAGIKDYDAMLECITWSEYLDDKTKHYLRDVLDKACLNEKQRDHYKKIRKGSLLKL